MSVGGYSWSFRRRRERWLRRTGLDYGLPARSGTGDGGDGGAGGATGDGGGGGSASSGAYDDQSDDTCQEHTTSDDSTEATATQELTPSETPTSTPPPTLTPTPEIVPGFGAGAWAVAIGVLFAVLALRRRD